MNKCGLCQKNYDNITKVYNNRLKTLAQIILKLKGFKKSSEINNGLSICENCRQGVENVANFWEHLPDAKQENFSNNSSSIQEIYETSETVTSCNSKEEMVTNITQHLPVIKLTSKFLKQYDDPKKSIKLKIKRIKEKNDAYTVVNSNSTEELSQKRLRRPPKRYNDFKINFSSTTEKVKVNNKNIKENHIVPNESILNKSSPMATIRSSNGLNLGYLIEMENNFQTSRMRMYKFNFDYHMAKHIPKKGFECSFCKKAFVMRYELKIHIRTHTKERPFKCEYCEHAFAHRSNLKAHQKLKHSKNLSNINLLQETFAVGENQQSYAKTFSDSEDNLNEIENTENISKGDESNLNSLLFTSKSGDIFLDNSKNKENDSNFLTENSKGYFSQIEENTEELKNVPYVIPPAEEENRIVVRSTTSIPDNLVYDYKKQFTSLYPIKLANTALRTIPQTSLLTMKKWPKSYQRAITESPKSKNVEYESSILECTKLNQTSEISNKHSNKVKSNNNFLERCKLSNESNFNDVDFNSKNDTIPNCTKLNDNENRETVAEFHSQPYTTTETSRRIEPESNIKTCKSYDQNITSTVYNNVYFDLDMVFANNTCTSINNVENSNARSDSTFSSEMCSYPKDYKKSEKTSKTINITKYCKFSPIVLDPNFLRDIKIIEVSNENKKQSSSIKLLDNLKVNNTKRKVKSPTGNEVKVSTKPVKILKLNNHKASDTVLIASNKMNLPIKSGILKSPSNHSISNGTASNVAEAPKNSSAQSLLKPVRKTQQEGYNSNSYTTPITSNLTQNLSTKPVITKVEILPSLNFTPSLQKSLKSSATSHMQTQPPKEYKHQCSHCFKYFKQKSALTKHLRTHTGEKPYKCNLCPKSYADASNYKKHKILHKNAAEALNISSTFTTTTVQPMQSSPAHSTVSDPDPDGIEVMRTTKKFEFSPSDENRDMYDDDDNDNASLSSSTMESYMWQEALDHALSNGEIRENIKTYLTSFNNAIMTNSVEQLQLTTNKFDSHNIYRSVSCEDPD